ARDVRRSADPGARADRDGPRSRAQRDDGHGAARRLLRLAGLPGLRRAVRTPGRGAEADPGLVARDQALASAASPSVSTQCVPRTVVITSRTAVQCRQRMTLPCAPP